MKPEIAEDDPMRLGRSRCVNVIQLNRIYILCEYEMHGDAR